MTDFEILLWSIGLPLGFWLTLLALFYIFDLLSIRKLIK